MKYVVPDSHLAQLVEQFGEEKAKFICEQWSKTATGTSSFPRFDQAKLTLSSNLQPHCRGARQ